MSWQTWLTVTGSQLMAHGSRLMAHDSRAHSALLVAFALARAHCSFVVVV
jgi:hypothetical protein